MTSWKIYKLSEIATLSTGFPFAGEKYAKEGIRVVRGDNVTIGALRWDNDKLKCWNEPFARANEFSLMNGDIVVGMDGSRVGLNRAQVKETDLPLLLAQRVACIRHNEKTTQDFLYYQIFSERFVKYIKQVQTGTSIPHVSLKQIGGFEVSLPSLEEQRRIAGILGAIDDKIENNRRINTNLELQAQALYKQWFVDNRSDDWETLMLDDVATLSAGGDKPQVCSDKKTPDCKIPIYSNGIDDEGLYGYTNNPRIKENSITISARGTIGFVCLRTEPYVPIVRLISVVPTYENMSAYFLYLWALTQNISGTGTTQQQLTVPAFRTTKIVVPSQNVLIKFNQVVKPIFDSIKQNKKENETLAILRDTLLPKLMNGEIKV